MLFEMSILEQDRRISKPLGKLIEILNVAIEENDEETVEKFCKILKLPDAIPNWSCILKKPVSMKTLQRLQQIGIRADTKIEGVQFILILLKYTEDYEILNYVVKEMMINTDNETRIKLLSKMVTVYTKNKRDKVDIKVLRLLIENGATLHKNMLTWVISECIHNIQLITLLVDAGSDVNENYQKKECCFVPIHWACAHGFKQIFEFLLERGANTNVLCNNGFNLLHLVLFGKKDEKSIKCIDIVQMAQRLVENDVGCIAQRCNSQKTPLERFVEHGLHKKYPDLCKKLIMVFYRAGAIVDWKMLNVLHVDCPSLDVKDLPTDILQHLLNYLQNAILRRDSGGATHRTTTEIWSPSLTDLTKVPYDQVMNAVFMFLYGTLPKAHSLHAKSGEMYGEKCGILAQPQIQGYDKKLVLYLLEEIKKSALILSSAVAVVALNDSNNNKNQEKESREPETKKLKN